MILPGKRVLLVEDEREVRQVTRMLLETFECVVEEAENGQIGFQLFEQGTYDLVVTDYKMPVMDGAEFTARVKTKAPAQRVLMITAYVSDLPSGPLRPDLILEKPYRLADLQGALEKLVVASPA